MSGLSPYNKIDKIGYILDCFERGDVLVLISLSKQDEMDAIQELVEAGLVVHAPSPADGDGFREYELK